MRPAAGALLLLCWVPASGQAPISDIHVEVASARITDLSCRRRAFEMEFAKSIGQSYRTLGRGMLTSDWDPRPFALGLFGMVIMAPLAVLSAPADLVAAPFRRDCGFQLDAQASLVGWAGARAGGAEVVARGSNLAAPGVEGASKPLYYVVTATAAADEQGRFSISIPGRVGRSSDFDVAWLVKGLPSGTLNVHKGVGVFVLSEPEPEFGSGVHAMEPVEVRPERKRLDAASAESKR